MILDFILIFTLIICIFIGYKNGITRMLVSIAIFIFSIALVTQIYSNIEKSFFDSQYGTEMVEKVSDNINKEIKKFTDSVSTDAPFLSKYFINDETINATENGVKTLSKKSIQVLLTIPLVIISFILLKLILALVKFLVSKTRSIPIIGGVDAFLGSVSGLVVGILLVWIIYMAVNYLQFLPSAPLLKEQLGTSLIAMLISDFLHI